MTNHETGPQPCDVPTPPRPAGGGARLIAAAILGLTLVLGNGLWLARQFRGQPAAAPIVSASDPNSPVRRINKVSDLPSGPVERIEVAYFYRTPRCWGCTEAERLTRKTIETYFADRLASGEFHLVTADVRKPQNAALARKYGANGSALYLGIVKSGVEYILPIGEVWLVVDNEARFMATLREKIDVVYTSD